MRVRALVLLAALLLSGCTALQQRATLGGPGACAPARWGSWQDSPAVFDAVSRQPHAERLFLPSALGAPLPQWVERYGEHQVQIVQWRPDATTTVDASSPGFRGERDHVVMSVYVARGTTPAEVGALAQRFAAMLGMRDPLAVGRAFANATSYGGWESGGEAGPSYQLEMTDVPDDAPLLSFLDALPTAKEQKDGAMVTLTWDQWRVALARPLARWDAGDVTLLVSPNGYVQASAPIVPNEPPDSLQQRIAAAFSRLALDAPTFDAWVGSSGCG